MGTIEIIVQLAAILLPTLIAGVAIWQARSADINKAVETINLAYAREREMREKAEVRIGNMEKVVGEVEELKKANQRLRRELAEERRARRALQREVEDLRRKIYHEPDTGPVQLE